MKRAFTLTELIVVMACLSVIFAAAMALFFTAFDFQLRYAEQTAAALSTDRLVEQFRKDARRLGQAVCEPTETVLLRWTDGDRQVEYELAPGPFPEKKIVIRNEKQGAIVLSTEKFTQPDDSRLKFVKGEGEFAGFLALSLWSDPLGIRDVNTDELDPFRRTVGESLKNRLDPGYAGNWRTVLVKE